jgi:hypothetical protein
LESTRADCKSASRSFKATIDRLFLEFHLEQHPAVEKLVQLQALVPEEAYADGIEKQLKAMAEDTKPK